MVKLSAPTPAFEFVNGSYKKASRYLTCYSTLGEGWPKRLNLEAD